MVLADSVDCVDAVWAPVGRGLLNEASSVGDNVAAASSSLVGDSLRATKPGLERDVVDVIWGRCRPWANFSLRASLSFCKRGLSALAAACLLASLAGLFEGSRAGPSDERLAGLCISKAAPKGSATVPAVPVVVSLRPRSSFSRRGCGNELSSVRGEAVAVAVAPCRRKGGFVVVSDDLRGFSQDEGDVGVG